MKVLIVAESEKTVSSLKTLFKKQGSYETITYRLLIKAMDNIEEISPTIIVISAVDYPRHWKIFMQYVNAVYTSLVCDVVLIIDTRFDKTEKDKAEALGVWKTLSESKLNKFVNSAAIGTVDFMDIVNENDGETEVTKKSKKTEDTPKEIQEKIKTIVNPPSTVQETSVDEKEFEDAQLEQEHLLSKNQKNTLGDAFLGDDDIFNSDPFAFPEIEKKQKSRKKTKETKNALSNVQLLFVHPDTGYLVTGLVQEITDKTIIFKPDNKQSLKTFSDGQLISSASYKNGESIRLIDASVLLVDNTLELSIQQREAV